MAQVLVLVQRLDRRTRRRRLAIDRDFDAPAFDLSDFDLAAFDEPVAEAPQPPAAPAPVAAMDPGGIAYITVTDAAGRVLFRRPATAQEVTDALRSADEAHGEGEAAMERIAYDRIYTEVMGELE